MAINGASRRGLVGVLLASCVLLAGCPQATQRVTVTPSASQEPIIDPVYQKIRGVLVGPKALGDGTRIVGSEENDGSFGDIFEDLIASEEAEATEEADASPDAEASEDATASADATASEETGASGGAGYRLAQIATCDEILTPQPGELPVEFATVLVKSYKLKLVNQLVPKPSGEDGSFYFNYVPAEVAFFIDATYTVDGTKYQMFGLIRTGETGETTCMKVDVASTLVARLMFRLWQQSAYYIDFRDVLPRDYNPLLLYLRKILADGMPDGISLDLSKTRVPFGEFLDSNDQPTDDNDSAVTALNALAKKDATVDREIDRLYEAVRKLYPNIRFTRYR